MSIHRLMSSRSFYPLFWTQFLGAFNDNLLKNALVMAVTIKAIGVFGLPTEQTVALAGGLFILPFFLFSAIAGELSDKYDKSLVLQRTKILEILTMLFSAGALYVENYDFLMVTLFFMGLQSTFFGPAKFSILPQHLPLEKIIAANAWVEAGTFVAILLGTILGGLLIALPAGNDIVAMILVAIAVIGYLTSRWIPSAPSTTSQLKISYNPLTTTWRQFRFSLAQRDVFWTMMAGSWFWFVGAFVLSLLPALCTKHFKSDPQLITLLLTVFSVGIGLGSFLCAKLSRHQIKLSLVVWGALGMSMSLLALSIAHQTASSEFVTVQEFILSPIGFYVLLFFLVLSISSGLYIVPLNAFIQEKSDLRVRSQVIAAYNISNSFFMVLSSLFLMLLFAWKVHFSILFFILFFLSVIVFAMCWRFLRSQNSY